MRSSFALAPSRGSTELRRRLRFFFHDYVDPLSRILELGPAEGAAEPYLREAGFHAYTRLDREPPADLVGEVRAWRQLGLAAASFEVIVAFDLSAWEGGAEACVELLAPGGVLYATAPLPGRARLARARAALGLGPVPRRPAVATLDLAALPGLRLLALRRHGFVEQWAKLRKPLPA